MLAALAHHLGLQEDEVGEREEADEGGVRERRLARARLGHAAADGGAVEQRLEPTVTTTSGTPTRRRWKVTRKATSA